MCIIQPNNKLSCILDDPNGKKCLMKPVYIIAIVLIVFGVLGLGYSGFSYTRRERVVDIGPIKADADVKHTVYIAPVVGLASLVGGIVLLLVNRRGSGS
jgi:hypothetical protein